MPSNGNKRWKSARCRKIDYSYFHAVLRGNEGPILFFSHGNGDEMVTVAEEVVEIRQWGGGADRAVCLWIAQGSVVEGEALGGLKCNFSNIT